MQQQLNERVLARKVQERIKEVKYSEDRTTPFYLSKKAKKNIMAEERLDTFFLFFFFS